MNDFFLTARREDGGRDWQAGEIKCGASVGTVPSLAANRLIVVTLEANMIQWRRRRRRSGGLQAPLPAVL